jgi:hypothetical protein
MTRLVDDKDIDNGQLVEETNDFYAQDVQGDVWYMGEITTHYVNGHLTDHADTWFGGQKRAKPGVIMLATPQIGSAYQQESAPNLAIDRGRVIALNESLCVPMRCFSGVMQIEETARLDPGVIEEKYYESEVGVIKSVIVQGDPEEQDLVSVTPPS